MALFRRAAKRDAAEAAVIEALRLYGFTVQQVSIPHGPDLLIGRDDITRVAEVKTGKGKLKAGQLDWWNSWRGNRVLVLRTVDDVKDVSLRWRFIDWRY